jgi:prepilin-type N-terminal cleavage/methylation domain-containing protein
VGSIGYQISLNGIGRADTRLIAISNLSLVAVLGKRKSVAMRKANSSSGFTILEMLMSVVVMGIMLAAAIIEMQPTIQQMHANSGAYLLEGQMRLARQMSIAQRRDIQIQFLGNNEIKVTRQEIPVGTTVLSDVFLPPTVQYMLFAGNGDTPDAFGAGQAICFGTVPGCVNPPIMQFQSDGTFIDTNGNQLNGTAFIGVANIPTTGRAITIIGATGQVRMYRATGSGWIQQ